jgi:hypothetical protein
MSSHPENRSKALPDVLSKQELESMDAYWRAANFFR